MTYLHIFPINIARLGRLTHFYRLSIDFKEIFVILKFPQEIVSIVLVLKRNKSLASEMRKCERRGLINSILVASIKILFIDHLYLLRLDC